MVQIGCPTGWMGGWWVVISAKTKDQSINKTIICDSLPISETGRHLYLPISSAHRHMGLLITFT